MKKLLLLTSLAVFTTISQAAIVLYGATLDGLQEAPPNASPATGSVSLSVDTVTGAWTLTGTFGGLLGSPTAAHIHGPAGMGVNAAVLKALTLEIGTLSGTEANFGGFYTVSQLADLAAGLHYVNLHSNVIPGGEIRGQLTPVPEPGTYAMIAGVGLCVFAVWRRHTRA